jgi:2-C-methyl-D-erythritol 4-phosphate cytidylyltransferase/2-C-methyl-D-erythritol 2,4-cyclodiphosphate synthase
MGGALSQIYEVGIMTNAAIVLAGGSGTRAGGQLPKQYQLVAGKALLRHTIEAFHKHPGIRSIQVVIAKGDEERYNTAITGLEGINAPVIGGATRQESGYFGIEALAKRAPQNVLIHDAARPFVSSKLISHVLAALDRHAAVVPALPVRDTLKCAPGGVIARTVDREGLWAAQTPQGFRYDLIRKAHTRAREANCSDFTDDASIVEWAGAEVVVVPGEEANVKLTTADNLKQAEGRLIGDRYQLCPDVRVGQGFDVHPFEPGDEVVLCGVSIPHHARLRGHSDADAAMHALTDALLGSIGEGDIGAHFPPSDARWKNAASAIFLSHAVELIEKRGGFIANADITIICEAPKIAPHISAMREILSRLMRVSPERIAIKATTSERLGFTGRGEGLAAFATAIVRLP